MKKSLLKRLGNNALANRSWLAFWDDHPGKDPDDTWILKDLRYQMAMEHYVDRIEEVEYRCERESERYGNGSKYAARAFEDLRTMRREYAQIKRILKEHQ